MGWEEGFSLYSCCVFLILEPYECITYRGKRHGEGFKISVHMCVCLRRITAFVRCSKGTVIPASSDLLPDALCGREKVPAPL